MASEPAGLHVNCAHCGAALTLQFKDWPQTLEAASKPPATQAWVCPVCLKKNSGQFTATLGWVWKGHRPM